MAETLGKVEIEITGNTEPFEQAIAKIRKAASDLGSTSAKILPFDTSKVRQATKELEQGGNAVKEVFRDVASSIAALQGPLGPIAGRINFLGSLFSRVGLAVGGFTVATAGAAFAAKQAVDAFADEEQQLLTLNAVLKATGGAAGQTSASLAALATGISRTTLATDDAVRSAEAMMLTFRSIGGDEFPRAMKAAQDLAATGFGSITSNAVALGRALEDPIRGIDRLRRSGVSFSAQQKQVIKDLFQTGQTAAAQREVLKAIEVQVGGAGAAQASGLTGAWHSFSEAVNDSQVQMGEWVSRALHLPSIFRGLAAAIHLTTDATDELNDKEKELLKTATDAADFEAKRTKLKLEQQEALLAAQEKVQQRTDSLAAATAAAQTAVPKTDEEQRQLIELNTMMDIVTRSLAAFNKGYRDNITITNEMIAARKKEIQDAEELEQRYEGAAKALSDQRDALMRTVIAQRIHDEQTKANLPPMSQQGRALAQQVTAFYELERAMKAAGAAGVDLDKLKVAIDNLNSSIIVTGAGLGNWMTNLDRIRKATQDAADAEIKFDAALRDARQNPKAIADATYDLALARERAAGTAEPDARIIARKEATLAEAAATYQLVEAKREDTLASKQSRDLAEYNLTLINKSIEQQNALRAAFQLKQKAEADALRTGNAYDKAALAAEQKLAADTEHFNQKAREASAEMDLMFEKSTKFMSEADKAGAAMARNLFGATWQQNLDDSRVKMARLNVELQQAYDTTREFAGTFVNDILDGKNAVDALSDALKGLEKRIIDMALDAVIKGMFAAITGGSGSGNIFSMIAGASSGGSGNTVPQAQTGGFIGSTPLHRSKVKFSGKMAYDEFPAILHIGERVIPAGGGEPKLGISGDQMVRVLGGIPHFEGGFNAAAAAAGAYTAGDTGAGGRWSSVSGGGGNISLSNALASQYTTSVGAGTMSLGAGSRGGGGVVSIPRPIARPIISVAPRVVAPRVVAPIAAAVPIPRVRDWTEGLLSSIPAETSFDRTRLPGANQFSIFDQRSGAPQVKTKIIGYTYTNAPSQFATPAYRSSGSAASVIPSGGYRMPGSWGTGTPTVGVPRGFENIFGSGSSSGPSLIGSQHDPTQPIIGLPPGVFTPGPLVTGAFPPTPWGPGTPGGPVPFPSTSIFRQPGFPYTPTPRGMPIGGPGTFRPGGFPLAPATGFGAFPWARPPVTRAGNVIDDTVPGRSGGDTVAGRSAGDIAGRGTGGVSPVYPSLLNVDTTAVRSGRGVTTVGPGGGDITPLRFTGGGRVRQPVVDDAGVRQVPADDQYKTSDDLAITGRGGEWKSARPNDDTGPVISADPFALSHWPTDYHGWMRDPITGKFLSPAELTNPFQPTSRTLAPRIIEKAFPEVAPTYGRPFGQPTPLYPGFTPSRSPLGRQSYLGGGAVGLISTGGSLNPPNVGEQSTYDTMRAHTEDARNIDILATAGRLGMSILTGYGNLVGRPLTTGIDKASEAIFGLGRGTNIGYLSPKDAMAGASAITQQFRGLPIPPGPPGYTNLPLRSPFRSGSSNVVDQRLRYSNTGELLSRSALVPERYRDMFPYGLPAGYYPEYDKVTGQPTGAVVRPYSVHHAGGYVGSTPTPRRWLPSNIFFSAPRLHDGIGPDEYPAILQRGERVIPSGGGGRGSTVNVYVTNNSNAQVTTQSSEEDSSGGVRLDIVIDQLVSSKMRDGGSQISRTMAGMGARAQPLRR